MSNLPKVQPQKTDRAHRAVRWTLGAVFVAAGALKLVHPGTFHADLLAYGIGVPDGFFRFLAVVLPWIEVGSGALLLANVWTETVGPVVAALSLVFVLALGQAVWRGLDLRCGCFGTWTPAWLDRPTVALARSVVLLAASLWLLMRAAGSHEHESNVVGKNDHP